MTSFIDSSFVDVVLPKTVYAISGFIFGQLIDNFINQGTYLLVRGTQHCLDSKLFIHLLIVFLCVTFVNVNNATYGSNELGNNMKYKRELRMQDSEI